MTTYDVTDGGKVNSSALTHVYYDADTETVYLVFKNGTVAAYGDFPSSTYEAFIGYHSLGQFYHWYIQGSGKFPGVSVDQDAEFVNRKNEVSDETKAEKVHVRQHPETANAELKKFSVKFRYETTDEWDVEATDFEAAIQQVKDRVEGAVVEKVTYEVE